MGKYILKMHSGKKGSSGEHEVTQLVLGLLSINLHWHPLQDSTITGEDDANHHNTPVQKGLLLMLNKLLTSPRGPHASIAFLDEGAKMFA